MHSARRSVLGYIKVRCIDRVCAQSRSGSIIEQTQSIEFNILEDGSSNEVCGLSDIDFVENRSDDKLHGDDVKRNRAEYAMLQTNHVVLVRIYLGGRYIYA